MEAYFCKGQAAMSIGKEKKFIIFFEMLLGKSTVLLLWIKKFIPITNVGCDFKCMMFSYFVRR